MFVQEDMGFMKGKEKQNRRHFYVICAFFTVIFLLTACTGNTSGKDSGSVAGISETPEVSASEISETTQVSTITTTNISTTAAATAGATTASSGNVVGTTKSINVPQIMSGFNPKEINAHYSPSELYIEPDMEMKDGTFYLYRHSEGLDYAFHPMVLFQEDDVQILEGLIEDVLSSQHNAVFSSIRVYRGEDLLADMTSVYKAGVSTRDARLVAVVERDGIFAAIISLNAYREQGCEQEFWWLDLNAETLVPYYLGRFAMNGEVNHIEIGDIAIDEDGTLVFENFGMLQPDMTVMEAQLLRLNIYPPQDAVPIVTEIKPGYLRNKVNPELTKTMDVLDRSDKLSDEFKAEVLKVFAGTWLMDGQEGAASIEIQKDGTFISYYASGAEEFRGTVEVVDNLPKFLVQRVKEDGGLEFVYYLEYEFYRDALSAKMTHMSFERME